MWGKNQEKGRHQPDVQTESLVIFEEKFKEFLKSVDSNIEHKTNSIVLKYFGMKFQIVSLVLTTMIGSLVIQLAAVGLFININDKNLSAYTQTLVSYDKKLEKFGENLEKIVKEMRSHTHITIHQNRTPNRGMHQNRKPNRIPASVTPVKNSTLVDEPLKELLLKPL